MAMIDTLLPEFDQEMGVTRRLLERVADDKLAWKPHEKSMSLGRLATHIAELPQFAGRIVDNPGFEIRTDRYVPSVKGSRAEILDTFDANIVAARKALAEKSDAELTAMWTFKRDGQTLFCVPRIGALRRFFLNHIIHHRGQLSVYLRLTNTPVPSIYGPSADEG